MIPELRRELIALLDAEGLPSALFNDDGFWLPFLQRLTADLLDKPLRFPRDSGGNKKGIAALKKLRKEMAGKPAAVVSEITLYRDEQRKGHVKLTVDKEFEGKLGYVHLLVPFFLGR